MLSKFGTTRERTNLSTACRKSWHEPLDRWSLTHAQVPLAPASSEIVVLAGLLPPRHIDLHLGLPDCIGIGVQGGYSGHVTFQQRYMTSG